MSVDKIAQSERKQSTQKFFGLSKQLEVQRLSMHIINELSMFLLLENYIGVVTDEIHSPINLFLTQLAEGLLAEMQYNELTLYDLVQLTTEEQSKIGILLLYGEINQMKDRLAKQNNGMASDLSIRLDKEQRLLRSALSAMPCNREAFFIERCQGVGRCYEKTLEDIRIYSDLRADQYRSPFFNERAVSLAKVICDALDRLWKQIFWQPKLDNAEKQLVAVAEQGEQHLGVLSR